MSEQVKPRIEGYYWATHKNERVIAYYDSKFRSWHCIGSNIVFYDKDFTFISEIIQEK